MNDFLRPYAPPPTPFVSDDGTSFYPGAIYAAIPGYRSLQLDLWVPASDGPVPVVAWIHGGAWMVGHRRVLPPPFATDEVFSALTAAGIAVATIEYRHALEAPFPAQLHDANAAVRWLREYAPELGIDPNRVGVAGESAGAHLASLVALASGDERIAGDIGVASGSTAVTCAVSWFGVSDIDAMVEPKTPAEVLAKLPESARRPPLAILLDGVGDEIRAAASPVRHVGPESPPFLLIHGTADQVVPHEQSEILARALTDAGVPVELYSVEGAGHGFDGCPEAPEILKATVDFFRESFSPVK